MWQDKPAPNAPTSRSSTRDSSGSPVRIAVSGSQNGSSSLVTHCFPFQWSCSLTTTLCASSYGNWYRSGRAARRDSSNDHLGSKDCKSCAMVALEAGQDSDTDMGTDSGQGNSAHH